MSEVQTARRLLRNSVFLYFRSFIVMLIGLYLSRITLQYLGVEDFGIYNVVGSVVVSFSFLNGAIANTCTRFFNVELGKGDTKRLNEYFCSSVTITILIAAFMFLLVELLGVYFIESKATIPPDRLFASRVALHLSALTTVVNTISIPYNSLIVVHERMKAYGYIDIINSVLKLGAVMLMVYIPYDRLIYYGIVVFLIQVTNRMINVGYCNRTFREIRFRFMFNRQMYKELSGYSFWVVFNSVSSILTFQVLPVLYNMYFGLVANAALGISQHIRQVSINLTGNISVSFGPQLVQKYWQHNMEAVKKLYLTGSKVIFSVYTFITIVAVVDGQYYLALWLGDVPQYTYGFMVLLILMCVIGGLNPLGSTLKGATGKIALFQGSVAAISYVSLFCSYVAMKMGCDVYMPYALLDAFNLISCFFCIYLCCRDVKMSYFYYLYSYLRMCLAYALAIGIAWLLRPSMEATFVAHALHSVFTLAFYAASVYLIGFNKTEKTFLLSIIKRKS